MAPCVTPLPRVSSTTVISSPLAIRSNTARRVGSARARMTVSMVAISTMTNQLVIANALVNTNGSKNHSTDWLTFREAHFHIQPHG